MAIIIYVTPLLAKSDCYKLATQNTQLIDYQKHLTLSQGERKVKIIIDLLPFEK
jgi:hypothetical protein